MTLVAVSPELSACSARQRCAPLLVAHNPYLGGAACRCILHVQGMCQPIELSGGLAYNDSHLSHSHKRAVFLRSFFLQYLQKSLGAMVGLLTHCDGGSS